MIDMASVYAKRFEKNPQMLQAAVMGQSPDPKLDPYTALNALRLIKESNMMAMAGRAQQPTSSPSLVAENMAPQMGLGAMVPGAMGQAPQGQAPAPQAPAPQAPPMQAASGGLASMPTPEYDYAEGGIVAFQSGGLNMPTPAVSADPLAKMEMPAVSADPFARSAEGEGEGEIEQDDFLALLDEMEGGGGSPAGLAAANKMVRGVARRIASRDLRDLSPEEEERAYEKAFGRITKAAGPTPYAAMRADLAQQEKERAGNLEFAKGEALLQAAADVLEGNNAMRGLARGGAKFAKVYGEAQRADKAARRSAAEMQFHIADAERKERAGNSRAASAAVESARKERRDLNKAELDRDIALGRLSTEMGKFNKPARAAGAAGADKEQPLDRVTAALNDKLIEMKARNPDDPQIPILEAKIKGRKEILGIGKEGPTAAARATAATTSKENIAAQNALADFKSLRKTAWKKYVESYGGDEKAAETAYKSGWMTVNPNASSDDFDPDKAVDYVPTAKPTAGAKQKVIKLD